MKRHVLVLIYFTTVIGSLDAQLLEGLYCGKNNCYDVLKVTRDTPKAEIAKSYRRLAKQYHPDVHRDSAEKEKAEEQFKIIATAYEILKDEESRADYDYMLDHPDEYYANYYRYYRRRMAPKVDVRIVVFVTISIISIIQYYSAWQRYETAIKHFMNQPKYRMKAMEMAREEGMLQNGTRRTTRGKSKQEIKEEEDNLVRKIIEDKMDIKGAYAKPSIQDILWIQILISPYTIIMYIIWYFTWIVKYTILRNPYGTEEKLYLIRKNLKMGQHQFDGIEDKDKEDYLEKELWKKDVFLKWYKEEEEKMKKALAENPKYKAYRRYLKNHGVGRMTFDES